MTLRYLFLATLTSLALMAGAAYAQDEEGGLLEGDTPADESDPVDPGGLLERKAPTAKVEVVDPDADLLKEVDTRRDAVQQRIMNTQAAASRFVKLQGAAEKSTAHFLKVLEGFVAKHNDLMYKYREAVEGGKPDTQKKLAVEVAKVRRAFLKDLEAVGKGLTKTEEEISKLEAKLVEEAKEGGGE